MNANEFVAALVSEVHQPSCQDTASSLSKPPGRRPTKRSQDLSTWYNALSPADARRVHEVIEHAVHAALFGTLCVLDGARPIGSERVELHLLAAGEKSSERLNDPKSRDLHDIYQAAVYEHVFGTTP